jgi:tRNA (cmo5U34)-methyltransferase
MVQQADSSASDAQRAGHHWKEADRVAEYIQKTDTEFPEAQEVYGLIAATMPFERSAPLRILDIGSGHGVVAGALLSQLPAARAIGLDISEPMMAEGRIRMASFGERFTYHAGDFADGTLPNDLEPTFDLVVSSRAIHHLESPQKQRLFGAICSRLSETGAFFLIDNMRPRDRYFRDVYRRGRQRPSPSASRGTGDGGTEHPDPVDDQVAWLLEAGFAHADCLWKKLGRALIVGYRS